jgi:hypothetical protein
MVAAWEAAMKPQCSWCCYWQWVSKIVLLVIDLHFQLAVLYGPCERLLALAIDFVLLQVQNAQASIRVGE